MADLVVSKSEEPRGTPEKPRPVHSHLFEKKERKGGFGAGEVHGSAEMTEYPLGDL